LPRDALPIPAQAQDLSICAERPLFFQP